MSVDHDFPYDPEKEPFVKHLVKEHMDMATNIARGFANRTRLEFDFFYDEAMYRLLYLARKFDPDRGVPFGAYLAASLRGYMLNMIRDHARPVRAPRKMSDLYLRFRKLRGVFTHVEAAEQLNVPLSQLTEMLEFYTTRYEVFTTPMHKEAIKPVIHIADYESELVEIGQNERLARSLQFLYNRATKDTGAV